MKYRRKRYARRSRRGFRRSRRTRFTKRRRTRRRSWLTKVYTFRRTNVDTLAISSAAPNPTYVFQLNEVPNYTEWTALYDQYMITKVVHKLIPRGDNSNNFTVQGTLFSVVDYNDSTALTSADQASEYAGVKRSRYFKTHARALRPKFQVPAYKTGSPLVFGYASRSGWLSCDNPEIPHYGLKFWWEGSSDGLVFDEYITYYVKFKNVK